MVKNRVALLACRTSFDLDTDGPLLFPALEEAGVDYEVVAWDDPKAKWHSYRSVVIRATWDYFERAEEFLGVLGRISEVTDLQNPLEVIEWNIDKRYLEELGGSGIPVVPSAFVAHLTPPVELGAALTNLDRWGSDEIVVKPTVSAGSNDTYRLASLDGAAIVDAVQAIVRSDRVAMIQPYLDEVDTYGERGCVYYNGSFDHAFTKAALLTRGGQAMDGLFLREEIGPAELTADERLAADRVSDWLTSRFGPLLYARIDLLPSPEGPLVVEVELIEPGLFFEADPPSAQRFADLLV